MSIKTHFISPPCYVYLQGLECLSLPHVQTLNTLYSSFGIENDFSTYLSQATSSFSSLERNVIVQMDEIHVKSDITYKGGKIFAPNLDPEDPTRTVFAVMVSSLHKKWSCISRLLPCGSISAEKIFPIIKECIIDIENCGLRVQIISTGNYPLSVNLFKLFSMSGKLETRVPHPFDPTRFPFLTFDFVHILKIIRNNWLNQKNFDKTMYFSKILLTLWKTFNVSAPFKGIRLNDNLSTPLILHDEHFIYLARIVYWLDAWQSLPGKSGKLSKQTYTSLKHACIALEQITNYLTESCGFSYVLSAFLQTDPLEHHFGLYRMMVGSNYHISYIQILESERRLKLSNILKMFSDQQDSCQSIHTFAKSFTSPFSTSSDDQMDLKPYLDGIGDVLSIEYTQ
ncbi:Transposable element P transposase [Oopsacas minuta]|uniref:Transposable element P transposase n=1 Tax=Oopsacas minuta TaxID=111878 RepID=A0AAV7JVJ0_9METZ|nr:Transposable element P transposase [Oopsacas minuta]